MNDDAMDLEDLLDETVIQALEKLDTLIETLRDCYLSDDENDDIAARVNKTHLAERAIVGHVESTLNIMERRIEAWTRWAEHLDDAVQCNSGRLTILQEPAEPCSCITGDYCEEGLRIREMCSANAEQGIA